MRFEDFLTKYWSQVVLALGFVACFGQLFFNLKYKKIEISFSLFQQNKISAVSNFYLNYAKVESMWHQLPIFDIYNQKISAKEMDNLIYPPLYELQKSILELKIYFSGDEHKNFQNILNNFYMINNNIKKHYINDYDEINTLYKTNDFSSVVDKVTNDNNLIINNISNVIKKSFSHSN